MNACVECGNDDPCEGYDLCSDCLEMCSCGAKPVRMKCLIHGARRAEPPSAGGRADPGQSPSPQIRTRNFG